MKHRIGQMVLFAKVMVTRPERSMEHDAKFFHVARTVFTRLYGFIFLEKRINEYYDSIKYRNFYRGFIIIIIIIDNTRITDD